MNSKKSLIFFYPSIEIGGLTKNLFSLINSLVKKNYLVTFITFEHTKDYKVKNKLYSFNKKINILTPKIKIKTESRLIKYLFCFFVL